MKNLAKLIYYEFRGVEKESHHGWNNATVVNYPYLTYTLESEVLDPNVEGFYIDVQMFDKGTSYSKIFELEEKIKTHFKNHTCMTEDVYVRFNVLRTSQVLTAAEDIKRRDLQIYCKVDWRRK